MRYGDIFILFQCRFQRGFQRGFQRKLFSINARHRYTRSWQVVHISQSVKPIFRSDLSALVQVLNYEDLILPTSGGPCTSGISCTSHTNYTMDTSNDQPSQSCWRYLLPATPRHMNQPLPLLPSGPDGVHNLSLRGDRQEIPLNKSRQGIL